MNYEVWNGKEWVGLFDNDHEGRLAKLAQELATYEYEPPLDAIAVIAEAERIMREAREAR